MARAAKNGEMTPQQRGALTRKRNAKRTMGSRYVQGFMSGYLLGIFDAGHGVKRGAKAVERIAMSSAKPDSDE